MKKTARMFIAAQLPEKAAEELAKTAERLKKEAPGNYTRRENYHITLAFLDEVERPATAKIDRAVREGIRGFAPVRAALGKLGYFGKPGDAVLWCGLSGEEKLCALAARIREQLAGAGIWFDRKPMKAHITLARRADVRGVSLERFRPAKTNAEIRDVTLYVSARRDGRPIYLPVCTHVLEGAGHGD